jgi:hypothetical protein
MVWTQNKGILGVFARTIDPAAHLRVKRSRWWRYFGTEMATTIGPCVYIPADWSEDQVRRVIPHEVAGHVRQFRAAGLGIHPWLGLPIMALIYFACVFPVGLAWGRYRLELHAETCAWHHGLRYGWMGPPDIRRRAKTFGAEVAGPAYGWPWPRRLVERGFKRRAEYVIAGLLR